jgi:hypothetical protein
MIIIPMLNFLSTFWLHRTKPKDLPAKDDHFATVFFFFGIFLLPFYKKIKKERLIDFLETLLHKKKYDRSVLYPLFEKKEIIILEKEITKLERRIKLEKLK